MFFETETLQVKLFTEIALFLLIKLGYDDDNFAETGPSLQLPVLTPRDEIPRDGKPLTSMRYLGPKIEKHALNKFEVYFLGNQTCAGRHRDTLLIQ